jgi:hypothetical protein
MFTPICTTDTSLPAATAGRNFDTSALGMKPIRRFSFAVGKSAKPKVEQLADEVVVHDVAVMTEGPAQGHFAEVEMPDGTTKEYQIFCDATTLQGVEAASSAFSTGVKVKADHGSGVMSVIGYLTGFRRATADDGKQQTKADFHIFKTVPNLDHLLKLIETLPDTMGFSAMFDQGLQKIGDAFFARCAELFSVDFVTDPAANPQGIFSRTVDTLHKFQAEPNPPMPDLPSDPQAFAAACMAALKPHLDAIHGRLGNLESRGMPTATTVSPTADTEGLYSRFEERVIGSAKVMSMVKESIAAELQNTSKTLAALGLVPGTGPVTSDPNSLDRRAGAKKVEDMTFTELIAAEFANPANANKRDFEIIRGLALAYPTKHLDARNKNELAKLPKRTVPFKAA